MKTVYLDYAASTPLDPRVFEKMFPFLTQHFGNAGSPHSSGKLAKQAIDAARQQVSALIHAEPSEIIWTSGATEANNLALKGIAALYQGKGRHIITAKTEHPSVLDSCLALEKQGFRVTYLRPDTHGVISLEKIRENISLDTILVSLMHVNNETGVIQDIHSIAELTASRGILFHVDAAQSADKCSLNVKKTPIDLISFCAHKLYGPQGVGALYIRQKPRVRVAALLHGGGQEMGLRSGTLPTAQIVGMGEAFALAKDAMPTEWQRISALRARFLKGISSTNTNGNPTVPHIVNIRFPENIFSYLPELAISQGSACLSKGVEPSYVLRALGLSEPEARSSIRFSFGRYTTLEDIDFAIECIINRISSPTRPTRGEENKFIYETASILIF